MAAGVKRIMHAEFVCGWDEALSGGTDVSARRLIDGQELCSVIGAAKKDL